MGRIYEVCYRNGGKFKWGFFPGILPKSAHFSQGTTASSFFDEITRLFSFFITSMSWRAWGGSLVMEFFSPWRASLELWSFETSCAAFIDFYPVFRSQTTFILQLFVLQRPFHSTTTRWAWSCSTDASFDLMQVRILWISLIFTLWWILLYFSEFSGTKVVQLNDDKLLLSCSYPAIMGFANIWFAATKETWALSTIVNTEGEKDDNLEEKTFSDRFTCSCRCAQLKTSWGRPRQSARSKRSPPRWAWSSNVPSEDTILLFFVKNKHSNQLLSRGRSGRPSRCGRGTSSWTTAPRG